MARARKVRIQRQFLAEILRRSAPLAIQGLLIASIQAFSTATTVYRPVEFYMVGGIGIVSQKL